MYKVFTVNKNGKIELTKEELQKLLDDSYWEGYRANTGTYVYTSPSWKPWSWTYYSNTTGDTFSTSLNSANVTIDASSVTTGKNGISTPTAGDSITFCLGDFAEAYAKGEITNEI